MENMSSQNHMKITKLSSEIMNFIEYTSSMETFNIRNTKFVYPIEFLPKFPMQTPNLCKCLKNKDFLRFDPTLFTQLNLQASVDIAYVFLFRVIPKTM